MSEPAPADEAIQWSAFYDDDGRIYYFNNATQESSWEAPDAPFHPPPTTEDTTTSDNKEDEKARWIAYKNDEGREYFFNPVTQETQWERPHGGVVATSVEEETADGNEQELSASQQEESSVKEETEEAQVEEEQAPPIDPAELAYQQAKDALANPDSIMEPDVLTHVKNIVDHDEGNPKEAIQALIDTYVGQTAQVGLLGRWLADLKGEKGDCIRNTVQDVIQKMTRERFTTTAGDRITSLTKTEAAFLESLMDSPRWRRVLIDLCAEYKDSALLKYCLSAISKRGHHAEIADRINPSEHYQVYRSMLTSELSTLAIKSVAAGTSDDDRSVHALVEKLDMTCSATSYTYLYSLETVRHLLLCAHECLQDASLDAPSRSRLQVAYRKWDAFRESLENSMVDLAVRGGSDSGPSMRNRRLDTALVASDVNQRYQRRRLDKNGNFLATADGNGESERTKNLETALFDFLRAHTRGTRIDESLLGPLLPSGLDMTTAGQETGRIILEYPVAIRGLLSLLYRPGPTRSVPASVRTSAARLIALAIVEAEKSALRELEQEEQSPKHDEVELMRVVLEGCELCEKLELLASFAVSNPGDESAGSLPSQKLCSLAFAYPIVAAGVLTWAKDLTNAPDFASSATFVTSSHSILSLVRVVSIQQPFVREDALDVAMTFLALNNRDVSADKIERIREQSLRLMLHMLVLGHAVSVIDRITDYLCTNTGGLGPQLIRCFVSGLLRVVDADSTCSAPFVRALARLLLTQKCIAALQARFSDHNLLKALLICMKKSLESAAVTSKNGLASVHSLVRMYKVES